MIHFEQVSKIFQGKPAVDDLTLHIAEGEFTVLIGTSGSGKSTTLKMINRLIEHDRGKILFAGEEIQSFKPQDLRRRMGYAIQSIGLFPHWTVEENIATVPQLLKWPRARIRDRVTELLELLHLEPDLFRRRYPHQLSGGQQQRIGVIRALAADPPVLLMDEPFGAVDPINRETIQNEFLDMQRQLKKTVMLVSHDIDEALKLGDRIAVFRQGKIVQNASADELLARPANDFVASFVGQDRTLKRLLLVQAGDVADQQETVTVRRETPLVEAFGLMDDIDARSVTVVDADGKPLGYVKRREARGAPGVCADSLHRFRVTARAEENLRVVLSKLYEHNTSWMPIVDEDGRYSGEISQDYIADYLSSGRTRRVLTPQ